MFHALDLIEIEINRQIVTIIKRTKTNRLCAGFYYIYTMKNSQKMKGKNWRTIERCQSYWKRAYRQIKSIHAIKILIEYVYFTLNTWGGTVDIELIYSLSTSNGCNLEENMPDTLAKVLQVTSKLPGYTKLEIRVTSVLSATTSLPYESTIQTTESNFK